MKKQEDVIFKGTKNGVLVILSDQQEYLLLKQKLASKLQAAEKFFFPGAHVTIDVGQRVLTSGQLLEMDELLRERHGLRLLNIIHSEPGEAVEQVAAAGSYPGPTYVPNSGVVLAGDFGEDRGGPRDPNEGGLVSDTVLLRRTLRSGQRVKHNGNVVILGDVNPGAEVIAAGDIVVMGVLRGVAHAGAMGNPKAVVAAFRLQPTQLRIANFITRAPDGDAAAPTGPEVAQIKNGIIVIEDYLPR
ncbi:MAG: septum site-determining protein MinC [Actinobacteria bacterium]|nr:septum site-determining protein MinC [Actinomycetota bacterium]